MKEQFLEAGEVVGTHGIRGEVKIYPWADGPEFLLNFDRLYLDGKPFMVTSMRIHKSVVLVKFQDVDDIETAQKLRGRTVTIDREGLLLEDGAVFIADLIGLPVYSEGRRIGVLQEVLTMPGNDVYVVEGEQRYMIPAVSEFLEKVDPESGEIHVRLIEGMAL